MITVIIPVYKNIDLFLNNLKHNLKFLRSCQIIIVNDDPSKSIKKEVKQLKNKNIILIENKKNLGFGMSIDVGSNYACNDYLFLLNSDVVLNDNQYLFALDHFKKNPNLFAVSFAQKEKNNQIMGKNIIYWKNGLFHHQKATNLKFGRTAWAEGGSCLIDKKKFNFLGGFDEIYSPFYWEDVDLSYRAWKSGFEIIFEPKILVEHHHQSTINKYFNKEIIKKIAFRNQVIFCWKNIADKNLFINHLTNLPKIIFEKGFFDALIKLPEIIKKRSLFIKKDEEILAIFKSLN